MRVGIFAASLAVFWTAANAALAACPQIKNKTCVDFAMTPNLPDRVVPTERPPLPTNLPAAATKPAYTGPIVGVTSTVHRAPTVGYRWAIN